jgi:serine/threonine-protein kinase
MRNCPQCERVYPDEMDFCPPDATPLTAAMPVTQSDLNFGLSQRYRIVRQLGEGGMGSVFLAEQTSLGNRLVALKVLRRRLLDDPAFLRRLQDEAASTGRIRDQNVVTVHECGQMEDGSPYIAMEFLEGETLGDAMQSRGALPLQEAAEILQQAARGLHAAHKLGIVHRDLKPDNIFLTRDDDGRLLVKILDFGIAKIRESETHTMTGLAVGTPAYMSLSKPRACAARRLTVVQTYTRWAWSSMK